MTIVNACLTFDAEGRLQLPVSKGVVNCHRLSVILTLSKLDWQGNAP